MRTTRNPVGRARGTASLANRPTSSLSGPGPVASDPDVPTPQPQPLPGQVSLASRQLSGERLWRSHSLGQQPGATGCQSIRQSLSASAEQHLAAVRLSLDNNLGKHAWSDAHPADPAATRGRLGGPPAPGAPAHPAHPRTRAPGAGARAAPRTGPTRQARARDPIRARDRPRARCRTRPTRPASTGAHANPVCLLPLLLQRLADHLVGQPGRVALAGKHADQVTDPGREGASPGGLDPFGDQPAGGRDLLLGAERGDCGTHFVNGDAPLAQLGGQRPPGQPAAVMPGLDPGPGERGIVDQPDLGEPAEDRLRDIVRHPAAAQRAGELRPGARPGGKQPQADLPRRLLRVRTPGCRITRIPSCGVTRPTIPGPSLSRPAACGPAA